MKKPKSKIIGKISLSSSSNDPISNISTSPNNNNNVNIINQEQKSPLTINHKRAKSTNKFKYIKNPQQINLNLIISNISKYQNNYYQTTSLLSNNTLKKNYHSLSPQYYKYNKTQKSKIIKQI